MTNAVTACNKLTVLVCKKGSFDVLCTGWSEILGMQAQQGNLVKTEDQQQVVV